MAGILEFLAEVAVTASQVPPGKRAWLELAGLVSAVILLLLAISLIANSAAVDLHRWL